MNVVDSSAWLDYLSNGPNADFFAPPIERPSVLIVPTVSIYEVFKKILQQRSELEALQAINVMQQGRVIDLSATLALAAAKASVDHHLPFTDAIILATAQAHNATLWTQDEHFDGLKNVKYRKHPDKRAR